MLLILKKVAMLETHKTMDSVDNEANTIIGESTKASDFESGLSMIRYKIEPNDDLVEKYADIMSKNERIDSKYNEARLLKKTSQLHL